MSQNLFAKQPGQQRQSQNNNEEQLQVEMMPSNDNYNNNNNNYYQDQNYNQNYQQQQQQFIQGRPVQLQQQGQPVQNFIYINSFQPGHNQHLILLHRYRESQARLYCISIFLFCVAIFGLIFSVLGQEYIATAGYILDITHYCFCYWSVKIAKQVVIDKIFENLKKCVKYLKWSYFFQFLSFTLTVLQILSQMQWAKNEQEENDDWKQYKKDKDEDERYTDDELKGYMGYLAIYLIVTILYHSCFGWYKYKYIQQAKNIYDHFVVQNPNWDQQRQQQQQQNQEEVPQWGSNPRMSELKSDALTTWLCGQT
ncbi:hypothetical protein PPERSA_10132 [Pseudocohnilembus persalinus]|uniref:Transmembrane protein n=1 Tax=Pseudocohnilembus persalinus TaxID=266149 RepID=A0A0V0R116_PSEPJ|nr:hypothetical protein PPERSA_10132 [Pseudocohnilembus persalinus]|eukprot:KRX07848.1 hypothetical protein PPERSA_10132 [Pseudocohnilembus persalinus]